MISNKRQAKKLKKLDEIHLVEAINLIYLLFDTDKFSRGKAIQLLKPKIISEDEYLIFRICQKIIRMGQTAENVFSMFDCNSNGTLTKTMVIDNIKKILEISFTDNDIKSLMTILDPKDTNSISREQFLSKISIKHYLEQTKDERITVSKSHFLEVLIEVYHIVQIKDTAILTSLFKSYNKAKINQTDFTEIISKIDNKLSQDQAEFYYNSALLQNSDATLDGVTIDAFIKCVFQNSIGKRGVRDFSNS